MRIPAPLSSLMRIAATLSVLIGAVCIIAAVVTEVGIRVDLVHLFNLGKPGRFYLIDIPLIVRITNWTIKGGLGALGLGLLGLWKERRRATIGIVLGSLATLWSIYANIGLGGW